MAAVSPQTILWEFERLSPAGSFVEAATSQSRQNVICHPVDKHRANLLSVRTKEVKSIK
jgi:hypothetical protein